MKLAWATDIHLDHATNSVRQRFYETLGEQADAVVLSGDIAQSPSIGRYLTGMAAIVQRPIFFVLGNHDFYQGSIADTRFYVAQVVSESQNLTYVSQSGVVELTPTTALVGHDGWADARLGDPDASTVVLNDYLLIEELRQRTSGIAGPTLRNQALRDALAALGDEAAGHLAKVLPEAAARYPQVIVVTHVPPFREAARYKDHPADDNFLPHFSCKAMGDVLLEVAAGHPACKLLVLCGHTHGGGELQVRENLRVLTGAAEYGKPENQCVFQVE